MTPSARTIRLTTAGVLVAVLLLAAPGARATLTLAEAIDQALSHNPSLSAAEHAAGAARWAHRQAKAQLLPSVSLQSSYTRLDEETVRRANAIGRELTMYFPDSSGVLQPFTIEIPQTVFQDGFQTSLTAQLLLLNPAVANGVTLTGASRDLARLQFSATRQDVAYQTLRAFVELLKVHSLVRVQRQYVDLAHQNAAQAERLLAVGRYAEADVLRWKVEEATQNGILAQQTSALRVAALTLENLLGVSPRGRVEPDSTLPAALTRELEHFQHLSPRAWHSFLEEPLEELVTGNPQLDILAETLRLTRLEHRQSLTRFLPSLTLNGSYGWQNNDTIELDGIKEWAMTAALSVPLFTSGANYSQRQMTKQKVSQTREETRAGRRAVLLAGEAARTAMHSNAEQLRLARTSLASARRIYEIRRNSFSLGRLNNLEWIDAQLALQGAEQTHVSSYYDLVLAIADYYQARGEVLALLAE